MGKGIGEGGKGMMGADCEKRDARRTMSRRDSWDEDAGLYEGHRWDNMLMCQYDGADITNAADMMTAGKMKGDSDR